MQTDLAEFIRSTDAGEEADRILRKCVHCGFCTATCPTYQLLGDELDGPRGRIYLIKQVLEGSTPTRTTQLHLDRCLTCRSCETTCPSGVEYGRLLDIGREVVESSVGRSSVDSFRRRALRAVLPYASRFGALLRVGRTVKPVLPRSLAGMIPDARPAGDWPTGGHERRMLVLDGCVQPSIAPGINVSAAQVLDRLGIQLLRCEDVCCGAVSFHLNAQDEARDFMRRNIDTWWPYVQDGVEALVTTASGCGVMVKDYAHALKDDPRYAEKAARISALTRDLCEVIGGEDLSAFRTVRSQRVAFHAPCTLQHGQQLRGRVESILTDLGFELTTVPDAHLCCGSAGTYSILNPDIAGELKSRKLAALESDAPQVIATANIGCLTHLDSESGVPVMHWIELLAQG